MHMYVIKHYKEIIFTWCIFRDLPILKFTDYCRLLPSVIGQQVKLKIHEILSLHNSTKYEN